MIGAALATPTPGCPNCARAPRELLQPRSAAPVPLGTRFELPSIRKKKAGSTKNAEAGEPEGSSASARGAYVGASGQVKSHGRDKNAHVAYFRPRRHGGGYPCAPWPRRSALHRLRGVSRRPKNAILGKARPPRSARPGCMREAAPSSLPSSRPWPSASSSTGTTGAAAVARRR